MGEVVQSVAGAVGGKLLGDFFGGDDDSASDAAQAAALQFRPYSVSTPFGWSAFNPAEGRFEFDFNEPRTKELYKQQRREASGGIERRTQVLYNKLQRIARPEEQETRRLTKQGLYSMGALGTHSGREMVGEVETAIQNARLNRALLARETAYNERQGAFGNYLAMSQMLTGQLGALSTNRNPAAGIAAAGMIQSGVADQVRAQRFGDQIGAQVGNALGNVNWGQAWDNVSSIFSPAPQNPYAVSGAGLYGPGGSGGFYGAF